MIQVINKNGKTSFGSKVVIYDKTGKVKNTPISISSVTNLEPLMIAYAIALG